MNTPFEDVISVFLSKITDYSILELDEEDLNEEFRMILFKAFSRFVTIKKCKLDKYLGEFTRELTDLEINIISSFMVSEWLTPKIYSITLLKPSLSSKEFTTYSQANHLKELIEIKTKIDKESHYWMNRYSLMSNFKRGDES